uniref:Cytochrome c-type biogenesis protein n=1 Tax=Nicotiana tabacum TaxID=4097 RepID=A0A1S4AQR3_TOBAC|nr:PREDICTED: cytochrome c-type biogenesis CcmH-like mitochondrial protein [Nicotiana tabacum]XP_016478838.1 PREDICTED: cytochrome c-type biogenesis CcmH-like mitochondrial protein [Nicotiana tabacum]
MEGEEDQVKKERVVEARARNISHNVRCTECGSQSIEDSQADIAILLRKIMSLHLRGAIAKSKRPKIFKKRLIAHGAPAFMARVRDYQLAAKIEILMFSYFFILARLMYTNLRSTALDSRARILFGL